MRSLFAALIAVFAFATPALADLSRLAVDVEAPRVTRAQGAIVGVRLQGLSGQEGRITTFGQAFRKGDWPKGSGLTALHEGRALALQTDVKARHEDGSVRHAILSLRNPGASDAQIELRVAPVQPERALAIGALVERGYDLTLDMAVDGKRVAVDAGALLREAVVQRRLDTWLSGPLVSEVRVTRRVSSSLMAVFDIRMLANGAVRTAVSVHNDDMFATRDRDIPYSYAIRMSGSTMVERQIKHRRYANWREIIWGGGQPSSAHVVYDGPYLIAAGALPPYDPNVSVGRDFFDRHTAKVEKGGTQPMDPAGITPGMPTTGGRADIGMVPDWTYAWIRAQSPQARAAMMANADAAGSVPWHFRDPKTGRAPTLDARPKFWPDYRANESVNGHAAIRTNVDGWKLDNAHQPDLSYVPYLITGDRYRLDELHAQLAYGLMSYNPRYRGDSAGNLSNEQVRGQAWVNRTHAYAAWVTPDDHPEKRYLVDKLRQRLLWYPAEYTRNDKRGGPASYETAGWIQGPHPKGVISNWQQDFFSQSLAQAMQMEFGEARAVYGFTRRYQINRFLRADFNGRWSTAYRVIHSDENTKVPYRTWREVAQVNINAGKFEANPSEMMGNPEASWNYVAQARAGYAAMVGAFSDPLIAEAYAFIVRDSLEMHPHFAENPKWSMVPLFPDGSTLPIANHRAVSGRATGTNGNDLMAGSEGGDIIASGAGNDIVAGFGGPDVISTGGGIDFAMGGAGDDRIFAEGGVVYAAGGPGRDVFVIGARVDGSPAPLGQVSIADFRPGVDRLSFPPSLGTPQQVMARARAMGRGTFIPTGQRGGVLLHSVRASDLRPDSFASR